MTVTITHRHSYAYMAWRRNPARDPSFRLQTEAEAIAQAERLAQERPGSTYIVMREIARVTLKPVPAAAPFQRRSVEPGDAPPPPASPGSKGGE